MRHARAAPRVRRVRRSLPWLLLVVLAAGYGYGRRDGSAAQRAPAAGGAQAARVVRVVDGDTVLVALGAGGTQERVRLIGVDTPETVKPRTPVQCFGRAASAEAHRLLDGRSVRLVPDVEARDRYGRMLAYVYRRPDGLFVNAELARRGFARQMTIPPNVRFADRFGALVAQARRAGRGLWKACGE
jgi:micrococcal nuclease